MDLYLVRHAIAEERSEFARTGKPDRERPLTDAGLAKLRGIVRGLARVAAKIEIIGTSPYRRARQTADVLASHYGVEVVVTETLAPGARPGAFADWVCSRDGKRVAAVGHEPDLSELAAWFATGSADPVFSFKKGGICHLNFAGPVDAGTGDLRWLLPPKLLRLLDETGE